MLKALFGVPVLVMLFIGTDNMLSLLLLWFKKIFNDVYEMNCFALHFSLLCVCFSILFLASFEASFITLRLEVNLGVV